MIKSQGARVTDSLLRIFVLALREIRMLKEIKFSHILTGSGFKTSDQVQGQGVPLIENGAYT